MEYLTNTHYFSPDGNYGDATDLVVLDTSNFTDEDWELLSYVRDSERASFALALAGTYDQRVFDGMSDDEVSDLRDLVIGYEAEYSL